MGPSRIGAAMQGAVADVAAGTQRAGLSFAEGLRMPWRGLKLVFFGGHGLAKYWLPPVLITFVALGLVIYGVLAWHDALVGLLWSPPAGEGFWASALRLLHFTLRAVVVVLLGLIGTVMVIASARIVASPFNDLLSERIEVILGGKEGPPFTLRLLISEAWRSVRMTLATTSLYFLVMLPLFVLSWLVPVIGQVLYVVFGFFFTATYLAIDFTDWPLARRGQGVRARATYVRAHRWALWGFGAGVWALLWVPLLNLLLMPGAVAGGTMLVLELERRAAKAATET